MERDGVFGCTWDGRERPGIPREKQKFCYSVAPPPPFLFRGLFEKTFTFTENTLAIVPFGFQIIDQKNQACRWCFFAIRWQIPSMVPIQNFSPTQGSSSSSSGVELHKLFLLLLSSAAIVIFIPRRRSGRKVGASVKK